MLQPDKLNPQPAGFGNCGVCAYVLGGTPEICFSCASQATEAPGDDRCRVCDQHTGPGLMGDVCSNFWCKEPVERRFFDIVWAIAMRHGELERAINRYKFHDMTGWAVVFGRILVGYLDEYEATFERYDLIVPSPTFVGPGARRQWDHIGRIVEKAAIEASGRWPFHLGSRPAIEKNIETPSMTGQSLSNRRAIAVADLRPALSVPDPAIVQGKAILVVDDVFTEGSTLSEVARALKLAGASSVGQVVLARQPWTP